MCPNTNNSSGKLKYPDIDVDKTAILKEQVDGLTENVKDVFSFTISFDRSPEEALDAKNREGYQHKLENARGMGYLEVAETYPRNYQATFRLTVSKALEVLRSRGITLDFQVHRTYLAKTEEGEKVVDFPKRPTTNPPLTPRAGVKQVIKVPTFTNLKKRPQDLHVPPQTVPVMFSHEFDIGEGNLPGWYANKEDFLEVRVAIWHEIMELAIIAITVEALYWPPDLYLYHFINKPVDNFADDVVEYYELFKLDKSKFLYWLGDPPFDYFEVSGYTREAEARRLEEIAIMLESQGNFSCAAGKWEEAEDAWEKTVEAWQAVPQHPEREKRVSAARARLAEVRAKKVEAQWKAASWDAVRASSNEISIRYGSWLVRFKAKIADAKGNVLASFDKPGGAGVITWGKGIETGIYFIKVESERVESRVRKVVIL